MAGGRPTVYVVAINPRDLELPFIRSHIDLLPADTVAIHGFIPEVNGAPVLHQGALTRLARKARRVVSQRPWDDEIAHGYVRAFARRPAAVLAEFGPTAVRLVEPCRRAGVPLIAHFHGYDISVRSVIDDHAEGYRQVFREAAAIVAVSRAMHAALLQLGAPAERLHYCPYGVDCRAFAGGEPAQAPPTALAVGRFVDKKAPHLTILAFADAHRRHPAARLRMIGDGTLRGACVDLVAALGLGDAVTFLGHQPHDVIAAEMRQARLFVQHSVVASNGDSEGTPNTILEAGASGLPVVSTRHAGIPDVVVEGTTGLLVDERDVTGMARAMSELLDDPARAGAMGHAARSHVCESFAMERRIGQLWSIIADALAASPQSKTAFARQALGSPLGSTPR